MRATMMTRRRRGCNVWWGRAWIEVRVGEAQWSSSKLLMGEMEVAAKANAQLQGWQYVDNILDRRLHFEVLLDL